MSIFHPKVVFLGRPGQWIYDAIKAGLVSLTKTMAYEFVDYGIRVNAVAPGWVVTEMHFGQHPDPQTRKKELEETPINSCIMKRRAHPEEIASVIAFLLSDDASYITGQTPPRRWRADGYEPAQILIPREDCSRK